MKRSIRAVTTGRGTEPSSSTASWNARMLNFAPASSPPFPGRARSRARPYNKRAPVRARQCNGPPPFRSHARAAQCNHACIERLLARPSLRMNAGVHNQARSAPDLITQHPETLVWRFVHAHLLPEVLAVQRPTLAVGRNVMCAEIGLVLVLGAIGIWKAWPGADSCSVSAVRL